MEIVRSIELDAAQLVLRQQLHRPLGATDTGSHEKHRFAALPGAPDLCRPIGNSATKFRRWLSPDVQRSFGRVTVGLAQRQLIEFGGVCELPFDVLPIDEQIARLWRPLRGCVRSPRNLRRSDPQLSTPAP